jgi:hypothetical protein
VHIGGGIGSLDISDTERAVHGGVTLRASYQSKWFATVNVDDAESSRASFAKVERLLSMLQPSAIERDRSTAAFTEADVQLLIEHVSDPALEIDLNYASSGGGMFNPLG